MLRDIIDINEELCVGCGSCVPNCHQGALEVIDGKVRLLSDLMCEGLGACIGHCPTGAMKVEKKEAPAYNEALVMEKMIKAGPSVIAAHLAHLARHNQSQYLEEAISILESRGLAVPNFQNLGKGHNDKPAVHHHSHGGGGCPGSAMRTLEPKASTSKSSESTHANLTENRVSELRQWPVQLHLLQATAPYLRGADLVLAADCSAYAIADFHGRFLRGRALAIACPKLDQNQDSYVQKLAAMISQGGINTLTVVIMEVPCCRGLEAIAKAALDLASRKVPIKRTVVGIEGEILEETWL